MAQLIPLGTTPSQSRPPRNIHDFYALKGDILGKGQYGVVERAESLLTHSQVAIKIQDSSPEAKAEACMLKYLQSVVHAVQFRDVFESEEKEKPKLFIVMDLVPDKNITETFLNPKTPHLRLTLDEIFCIARQGLEFFIDLEKHRTICFDFKPENLIFSRPSRSLTVVDLAGARKSGLGRLKMRVTPP